MGALEKSRKANEYVRGVRTYRVVLYEKGKKAPPTASPMSLDVIVRCQIGALIERLFRQMRGQPNSRKPAVICIRPLLL